MTQIGFVHTGKRKIFLWKYTLKQIVSHIYVASYSVAGSHMKMCRSRMCRIPDCVAAYSLSTHSAFCCARAATYKGHGRMYKSYTFSMSLTLEYFSSTRRSRIRRKLDDRDRTASKRFDRDQVDSRRRLSRCRRLVFGECEEDMRILLIPNESRSSNNPPPDALNSQKRQKLGSNHARRMCRKAKRQNVSLRAPSVAD